MAKCGAFGKWKKIIQRRLIELGVIRVKWRVLLPGHIILDDLLVKFVGLSPELKYFSRHNGGHNNTPITQLCLNVKQVFRPCKTFQGAWLISNSCINTKPHQAMTNMALIPLKI